MNYLLLVCLGVIWGSSYMFIRIAVAEVPAILAVVQNAHLADFSRQEWQALLGYLQRMLVNGKSMQNADAVTG